MQAQIPPRERLIIAAARLMREKGYEAMSMRAVVAQAEAPWGSLQHYFPGGKRQLALEAVEFTDHQVRGVIRACMRAAGTPQKGLRSFFDFALSTLEDGDFRLGCPIAAVALDASAGDEEIAAACREAIRVWQELIAEGLRARGVPAPRARELGAGTVAIYEGALIMSRLERDLGPMRTAADLIISGLDGESSHD
jgi:TetR/AcrR family transcriptional repressor of lmrAB and yxaGH operons